MSSTTSRARGAGRPEPAHRPRRHPLRSPRHTPDTPGTTHPAARASGTPAGFGARRAEPATGLLIRSRRRASPRLAARC